MPDLVELLATEARTRRVELDEHGPLEPASVRADARALARELFTAFLHALDAAGAGGRVYPATRGEGLGAGPRRARVRRHAGRAHVDVPEDGVSQRRHPRRVLIVDDDDDFRTSVSMVLEDERWEVREARHGAEALDIVREWHPSR